MTDIPTSQHSVFIRGFPANMDMTCIREFFEREIGHCTFEFFKTSMDKTKLFVALRFDTREIARDVVDRYDNGHVLGHLVHISFFKDIRRYGVECDQSKNLTMRNGGRIRSRYYGKWTTGNQNYVQRGRGFHPGQRGSFFSNGYGHNSGRFRSRYPRRFSPPPTRRNTHRSRSSRSSSSRSTSRGRSKTPSRSKSHSRGRSASEENKSRSSSSHTSKSPEKSKQTSQTTEKKTSESPKVGPKSLPASYQRTNWVTLTTERQTPDNEEHGTSAGERKRLGSTDSHKERSHSSDRRKRHKSRSSEKGNKCSCQECQGSSGGHIQRTTNGKTIIYNRSKPRNRESRKESDSDTSVCSKHNGSLCEDRRRKSTPDKKKDRTARSTSGSTSPSPTRKRRKTDRSRNSSESSRSSMSSGSGSTDSRRRGSSDSHSHSPSPPTPEDVTAERDSCNGDKDKHRETKEAEGNEEKERIQETSSTHSPSQHNTNAKKPAAEAVSETNTDDNLPRSSDREVSLSGELIHITNYALANVITDKDPVYEKKKHERRKLKQVSSKHEMEKERLMCIARLPPEDIQKMQDKRKEIEEAYKQNCETFATVVKILISKDSSLEEKLLGCLRESLKDIGQKFIAELHQFIDDMIDSVTQKDTTLPTDEFADKP